MKEMRSPNPSQRAQGSSQVLVIACRQNATAALAKTCNTLAIRNAETVAQIDGKQPKLVEVCLIERAENRIIPLSVSFAIARYNFAQRFTGCVFLRSEFVPQKREAIDVPIVGFEGNRRLHEDANWFCHSVS